MMKSQAIINTSGVQLILRNVGRIATLKKAIIKALEKSDQTRATTLQAELDRRLIEVESIKQAIDAL